MQTELTKNEIVIKEKVYFLKNFSLYYCNLA